MIAMATVDLPQFDPTDQADAPAPMQGQVEIDHRRYLAGPREVGDLRFGTPGSGCRSPCRSPT